MKTEAEVRRQFDRMTQLLERMQATNDRTPVEPSPQLHSTMNLFRGTYNALAWVLGEDEFDLPEGEIRMHLPEWLDAFEAAWSELASHTLAGDRRG
jgi:hypothetical protein